MSQARRNFMTRSTITDRVYQIITYHRRGVHFMRSELTNVTVDGVAYIRTGEVKSEVLFMRGLEWPRFPVVGDELYVFDNDQCMMPLAEWEATQTLPRLPLELEFRGSDFLN
jgi:hypothetical protein